jgi:general secretion pathway protein J
VSDTVSTSREDGFALLEAVVVLAITAMVFVALAVSTGLVVRNAKAMSERTNLAETLIGGLEAWRHDVAAAFIPGDVSNGPSMTGSADAMTFVTARFGIDGIPARVTYRAQSTQVDRTVANYTSVAADRSPAASAEAVLDGPWRFRFAYRARHGEGRWLDSWTRANELPAFVRLSVLTAQAPQTIIAEVVAPIRANRTTVCLDACVAVLDRTGRP